MSSCSGEESQGALKRSRRNLSNDLASVRTGASKPGGLSRVKVAGSGRTHSSVAMCCFREGLKLVLLKTRGCARNWKQKYVLIVRITNSHSHARVQEREHIA